MATEHSHDTPPRQRDDDTAADRQLSDEEMALSKGQPEPPESERGAELPDPKDVGEAG